MAKYCCDFDDVTSAMTLIRPYIVNTPLMTSSQLDKLSGWNIFLKTENFQKTGCVKMRGAKNAVLKIKQYSPSVKCVVTHSGGNFGKALAKVASNAGLKCFVVMDYGSIQYKINAVKRYRAIVQFCEPSEEGGKKKMEEIIAVHGGVIVKSSCPDCTAGQGTVAIEILEQNPDVDVIIAAVGGGGLISGIAIAAKSIKPSIKIIAAEPEVANDCYLSMNKGELTAFSTFPDTIADAIKCNVSSMTWPVIRDLVDDVITVTENEIKAATLLIWERSKLVIEPTAGVAVAAVLSDKFQRVKGQNVAVVLCGGNVDLKSITELMNDVHEY